LLFSGAAFGVRTASFANPADTEFLYFIQRPDRISTDDPVGTRPALSISEMACCRCDAGRRACPQGSGVISRTRIPDTGYRQRDLIG